MPIAIIAPENKHQGQCYRANLQTIDKSEISLLVLNDVSKAFDTVN